MGLGIIFRPDGYWLLSNASGIGDIWYPPCARVQEVLNRYVQAGKVDCTNVEDQITGRIFTMCTLDEGIAGPVAFCFKRALYGRECLIEQRPTVASLLVGARYA